MSRRQKRLARIRRSPKNVSFNDLKRVLEDYGFVLERTSGDHHIFSYMLGGEQKIFSVPFNRPVKSVYVRQALKIIDRIVQEQGSDEPED